MMETRKPGPERVPEALTLRRSKPLECSGSAFGRSTDSLP